MAKFFLGALAIMLFASCSSTHITVVRPSNKNKYGRAHPVIELSTKKRKKIRHRDVVSVVMTGTASDLEDLPAEWDRDASVLSHDRPIKKKGGYSVTFRPKVGQHGKGEIARPNGQQPLKYKVKRK